MAGIPAVIGPHVQNARQAASLLEESGAAERVEDGAGLGAAIRALLDDPNEADARGAAGRRVLAEHRGSGERAADLVESVLNPIPGAVPGEGGGA